MGLVCRPYAPSDESAVLSLVAADRLPGQPAITPAMLREAVAGNSIVDAGWWAELDPPRTEVLVEEGTGRVVGVVSYAVRQRRGVEAARGGDEPTRHDEPIPGGCRHRADHRRGHPVVRDDQGFPSSHGPQHLTAAVPQLPLADRPHRASLVID